MNLSVQAAPMALRLFEQSWQSIPALYNSILKWIVKVTARNFGLDETAVVMQRTTVADDAERKQILTQLMSANQISPQTALEPFGIDVKREVEKTFKHQEFVAKKQQEADEKAQQEQEMASVTQLAGAPTATSLAQQGAATAAQQASGMGGAPAGGQGGGGGGGGQQPTTIKGMSDQAEQIAGQLATMPDYDRKQQLKSLRENNQDLHSLVTSALKKVRTQAASQGQQQMLAPQPGGGTPGAR
jgi:archaellum component FlaC